MKTEPQAVTNQCVVTQDSLFLSCDQSKVFQLSFMLLLSIFLLAAFFNPFWLVCVFLLFILVRNPFTLEIHYMRGIGSQYRFHFSIAFKHFRLFCINGRFYGLSGEISEILVLKLAEFRSYHN